MDMGCFPSYLGLYTFLSTTFCNLKSISFTLFFFVVVVKCIPIMMLLKMDFFFFFFLDCTLLVYINIIDV